MADSDSVAAGNASKRVVKLADGTVLNRYWDARDVPRTESWMDDIATANKAPQRNKAEMYRDLRAGAASGWDFSSRWFTDAHNLSTIRTTQLAPVDLNSLMFHLEKTLSTAYRLNKQDAQAKAFADRAEKRQAAINRYLCGQQTGLVRRLRLENA